MIITTSSVPLDHPDLRRLVAELDAYLAITDGEEHAFYNQYNGLDDLTYAIVAYDELFRPIGCGAYKIHDSATVEIKRMYTAPDYRGRGVAAEVLLMLESIAKAEGYDRAILETGLRQEAAMAFYPKQGYANIPNYGQYQGMANSRCFEKQLRADD